MLKFGMLAGAMVATAMAGVAIAADVPTAAGAGYGAPMQPGAWGRGGWQAGATAPVAQQPVGPAPVIAGTPAPPAYAQNGAGWQRNDRWRDYRAPAHGHYRRPSPGWRMPTPYLDPVYAVIDWNAWGLGRPGPGMHWIRYYDDAVLVDSYGRVVDARENFGWDRGGPGYAPTLPYAGGYAPGQPYGYGPPPGMTTYSAGPNTTVTTSVVAAPPPVVVGGGYGYAGGYYAGGGSVVTVIPGTVVTTTTTTTDYETVYKAAAVRRVYHRPYRRPSHPRCVRTPTCPVLGS